MQYSLFPIHQQRLYELYKQACASFWVVDEVDLSNDKRDLEKLTPQERKLLLRVLAFFAASDAIVNENIIARFYEEVDFSEARAFYAMQMGIEAIHSEMYSLLIETYAEPQEKDALFQGIETYPTIAAKAAYCKKYMGDLPLNERMVAYAAVEGIMFSASFATIFYFKKRGLLPGLALSNQFIARDEGLHATFSAEVYKLLDRLPNERVYGIVVEAVQAECAFVRDECLDVAVIGLSAQTMCQYIEFIADRLLVDLGHPKKWGTANPFDFMELSGINVKTNFFESRVSEYQKAKHDHNFTISEDF